jgi:hypothetical protein
VNKKHLAPCLIGIAAAALLLAAIGVNPSTLLLFGVVLACPLLMFFMMKMMMGDKTQGRER